MAGLGKGNAIPLCFPNDMEWDQWRNKSKRLEGVERTSLILNPHALKILRSISGPVCVIAIVGPCRSGKSYILSRLISSTGVRAHFDLGHEMDPKTMGIWMWDQPFKMKLQNYNEEVTIILLDTEGVDAANATDQGDSQIFTLSVLLSSLMIYNSMSVPKREDLNQMKYPDYTSYMPIVVNIECDGVLAAKIRGLAAPLGLGGCWICPFMHIWASVIVGQRDQGIFISDLETQKPWTVAIRAQRGCY